MKDQEINIAIAEACGVKPSVNEYIVVSPDGKSICMSSESRTTCMKWLSDLKERFPLNEYCTWTVQPHYVWPAYTECLNAMHEAEMWLRNYSSNQQTDKVWKDWRKVLEYVAGPLESVHATARQRAEAFLRVKGLWKA
jgi:hypothetical protein